MSFEGPSFSSIDTPEPEQVLTEDGFNPEDVEATKEKIKKYEDEIHVILEALSLSQENKEEYISDQYESLLADAEKSLETGKAPLVSDLTVLEKSAELLRERLHAVVDADNNVQNENDRPDSTLLRGAKLSSIVSHDGYIIEKYYHGSPPLEEIRLDTLVRLISFKNGNSEEKPLTSDEIDILIKAGYGESLVKGIRSGYGIDKLIEDIPESLLLLYLNDDPRYFVINKALEQKIEKGETFSQACFQAILESSFSSYALRYFNAFEGVNILDAIRMYNPTYPYQAKDQIEIVQKLGLDTPDVLDAIIKNNSITRDHQESMRKIESFQNTLDEVDSIKYLDYREPNQDDLEAGLPMVRKMITEGNVGFLHEKYAYITWLVQNEYEWFMEQIVMNRQEHMFVREMKDETQVKYVESLIVEKDVPMLRVLFSDTDKVLWKKHVFDLEVYQQLKNLIPQTNLDLTKFKGLPPDLFRETLEKTSSKNGRAFQIVESFDFNSEEFTSEKEYQEYLKALKDKGLIDERSADSMRKESPIWMSNFETITKEEKEQWAQIFESLKKCFSEENESPTYNAMLDVVTRSRSKESPLFTLLEQNLEQAKQYIDDLYNLVHAKNGFYPNDMNEQLYAVFVLDISPEELGSMIPVVDSLRHTLNESGIQGQNALVYIDKVLNGNNLTEAIHIIEKIKMLVNEVSMFDVYVKKVYVKEFLDVDSSDDERNYFLERMETEVNALVHNEAITETGEMYEVVTRQVYPQRNYNTYTNIDAYTDRSADIAQFTFEKEGYATTLDGVSEYRVREGQTINPEILKKYSGRLQELGRIGNEAHLDNYLTVCLGEEAENHQTVEGKLLRYCEGKSDAEIADILLAYQLRNEYDALIAGTQDRITDTTSQTEKEYIMLVELAERYGDRLKETIKEVMGRVVVGPDKEQFVAQSEDLVSEEDISQLAEKIGSDLARIPGDKLTDALVQKKVATSLKARFQRVSHLKNNADAIAETFTVADISTIDQKLLEQITLVLKGEPIMGIDSSRIESIQNKTYQEIQTELEKYDEVMEEDTLKSELGAQEKSIVRRPIHGYFGKNRENAHARMVADVCLANDTNMLENPNYFEFVLFDEDRKKNIGTTMLLVMQDGDKKYLLYCPNPSVDIVSKVSSQKLYDWNTKQITEFARQNGFDGVLTDRRHGHSTNRPGKFYEALTSSLAKNPDGSEKTVSLADSHRLGGGYTYQNNLSVIWEK